MRKVRTTAWVAVIAAGVSLAAALSSCTRPGQSDPQLTPSPQQVSPASQPQWRPKKKASLVVMSEEDKLAARARLLESMRSDRGLPSMQFPALVRWIHLEETASVMVPCLQDKGFPVTANSSGTGYTGPMAGSQNKAFSMAELECYAMYTPDPRLMQVPDDEHKGIIYDYYTEFVIPCVRNLGFPMQDLPSRATWIANPQQLNDYPTQNDEVMKLCPLNTPSKALLGEDY